MDARELASVLEKEYGLFENRYVHSFPAQGKGDPLDTLILTILSQATNDRNSLLAYRRLRHRFPAWEEVLAASPAEVAEALRPGGLAVQKASRIQSILRAIQKERGELDLGFLSGMPTDWVFDYLVSFPGVGPKTAACVLVFSLDRPRFPVDTHVARVLSRLGLVKDGTSPIRIQEQMEDLVPDDLKLELHVNLIEHGRQTCLARSPRCESCPLSARCPTARHKAG